MSTGLYYIYVLVYRHTHVLYVHRSTVCRGRPVVVYSHDTHELDAYWYMFVRSGWRGKYSLFSLAPMSRSYVYAQTAKDAAERRQSDPCSSGPHMHTKPRYLCSDAYWE